MEEMVTLKLSTYNKMIEVENDLRGEIAELHEYLQDAIDDYDETSEKLDKFLEASFIEYKLGDNFWVQSFERNPDENYAYFFENEKTLRILYDVETLIGYVEFRIIQNSNEVE